MKTRVFSGIQPTGVIHIGNYLGAISNWVDLQEKYECIFSIVDLHALTVAYDIEALEKKSVEAANIYLAAGIDPGRSNMFIQSHLHHHTELTWLLNCVATMGELSRMTQFKDKARVRDESVPVGLFDYPILMAADILLYQTQLVPVRADQKQHVELARDLALRFNQRFGETFVVPEVGIREAGDRIMGLDDPTKKMSKTAPSAYNYIALTDNKPTIERKIAKAVTDSGNEIRSGPDKPALTNLLTIHSLFSGESISELETAYAGRGYAEFKRGLANAIISKLEPFRQRFERLSVEPERTNMILTKGARAIAPIAKQTLDSAKRNMGLNLPQKWPGDPASPSRLDLTTE